MAPLGLPKGGLNVAGHKVPWEMIGALAAVAGVLLVLRARSQGSSVSAGAPPAAAAAPLLSDFGATSPDVSGSIASLQDQLSSLATSINSTTAAPPAPPSLVTLQGEPGYRTNAAGQPILALWNAPNLAGGEFTELPAGTQLVSGGAPVQGQALQLGGGSSFWQPVQIQGQTKYVYAPDALSNSPLIQ